MSNQILPALGNELESYFNGIQRADRNSLIYGIRNDHPEDSALDLLKECLLHDEPDIVLGQLRIFVESQIASYKAISNPEKAQLQMNNVLRKDGVEYGVSVIITAYPKAILTNLSFKQLLLVERAYVSLASYYRDQQSDQLYPPYEHAVMQIRAMRLGMEMERTRSQIQS